MIVSDFGSADFLGQVLYRLKPFGTAAEQYLTESLGPALWAGSRPDLVFTPSKGPFAQVPHIVEFRGFRTPLAPNFVISQAADHASRIRAANSGRVRYALMLNTALAPAQQKLRDVFGGGFEILDRASNSLVAAELILEWARAK